MIGIHDSAGTTNGFAVASSEKDPVAGSEAFIKIQYTAGAEGIATGGCLRLSIWRYWSPIQLDVPDEPGYVTVDCAKPAVDWELSLMDPKAEPLSGSWYHRKGMPINSRLMHKFHALYVTLAKGELVEGEELTISYRGTAPKTGAMSYPFRIATDADGNRRAPYSGFLYIAENPRIFVAAGKLRAVEAHLPAQLAGPIDPGKAKIVGRDRFDNPCPLPEDPQIRVEGRRLRVVCGAIKAVSNYGREISTKPPAGSEVNRRLRCFWGDLHVHSERSDGIGSLEDVYEYARDVMGLDFVGHGDHTQYMGDQDWEDIKDLTRRMNDPGRFVSFPGYELSHNPSRFKADGTLGRIVPDYGDKNVYYLDEEVAPMLRVTDRNRSYHARFPDLVNEIRGLDAMIVPHIHAGGVMSYYDPEFVWLLEAFSAHHFDGDASGGWERFEGVTRECLASGWRVGLIGGSDNHNGRAAQDTYFPWKKKSRRGALMAVMAPELTREALWKAMRRRRVYATTGARILLDFTLNGEPMGSEVKVLDCTEPKSMHIRVHGTAPLQRIDVLRSNELLRSFDSCSWDFEVDYTDEEYSTGEDFYRVRILQKDGHRCWSTPIWVDLGVEARVNFPGQEKTWKR